MCIKWIAVLYGIVQTVVTEELQYQEVFSKWTPLILTDHHKEECMGWRLNHLLLYEADSICCLFKQWDVCLRQLLLINPAHDYVKHTAARSLLKLFLLKNQIIPNYLSQWIEENQTSLTKSSTELLLRRRLMSDIPELVEEDIVTI